MPKWSGVYEKLLNGNLGILPTSSVGTILAVGPCSLGEDGEIYYFGKADADALLSELGYGDLTYRLLDFFALGGQKAKAIVIPAEKDIAGGIGDVEYELIGSGGMPVLTPSGSPNGAFQFDIEILSGGDHEEATFRYSIDGGQNWSGPIATPAAGVPVALGYTGAFIAFGAGTFVEGDKALFDTIGPSCSLSSILTALNIGKDRKLPFEIAGVFTPTADAAWAALGQWGDDLFAGHKNARIVTEASLPDPDMSGDAYVTGGVSAMNGFAHDRVLVTAGTVRVVDLYGYTLERGLSGLVCGLIAASPVSQSIGRTLYCKMTPVLSLALELSDAQLQTLDEARYTVPRTHEGLAGFFVNNGNMAADATSDYQSIEVCRVMDNVIRIVRVAALKYVHMEVLVANGTADPAGLKALEGGCKDALKTIKSTFSSAGIVIPEGQDVIATQGVNATISVIPFGYAKAINLSFRLAKL